MQMKKPFNRRSSAAEWAVTWSVFFTGLLIMSGGIALMIRANLGASPWDVFHIGLYKHFGLTIGTWSIIVGLVIILSTCLLTRTWPQAGALLNMVLVGLFIDAFLAVIDTPSTLAGRWVMLGAGILVNGVGIAFYIAADKGAGPRDTLMLYLTEVTGWSIATIRRLLEAGALVCGWLMGGPVSFGTVVFALTIGTMVGRFLPPSRRVVKRLVSYAQGSGGSEHSLALMAERGAVLEDFNQGTIRPHHYDGPRPPLR